MKLHNKTKGTIGELLVTQYLLRHGYAVFIEVGDNSSVDLIAMTPKKGRAVKVQVKTYSPEKRNPDVVSISAHKQNGAYSYKYGEEDADVFALVVLEHDIIIFIPAKELHAKRSTLTFRLTAPKIKGKVNMATDYKSFAKALKAQGIT